MSWVVARMMFGGIGWGGKGSSGWLPGCCQGGCLGPYDILLLKYDVCFLQYVCDLCDYSLHFITNNNN